MNKNFMKFAALVAAAAAVSLTACKKDEVKVAVAGVSLSANVTTRAVGSTFSLTASVLPADASDKSVAWTTTNDTVATVSGGGTVTALKSGAATIVATTTDGSFTDTCALTVAADNLADNTLSLGTVSFASSQTWKVGSREWSDAVQATGCNKTEYLGYENSKVRADCRSNPGQKGNLFSWAAVIRYQDQLCPDGWRVPTKDDFIALDVALGGTGENRSGASYIPFINEKYLNLWGGSYGGYCYSDGTLGNQGASAVYWSQSEYNTGIGFYLNFGSVGSVNPQNIYSKDYGFPLRCVR